MRRSSAVAALGAAAALPLLLPPGGVALENLIVAAAYVVMALGLNVVVGFAGLLDLGYVAFFAIGAHVTAYFASAFWGLHFDFLVVLALAVIATTIAGVLIGLPALRVRGDYVGIVTLAFGEIIGVVVSNGRDIPLFGGTLTGGPFGMTAIDPIDLPFVGRFGPLDLRPWLVALVVVVDVRLRDSRIGRAWRALRDDEDAAASAGVPVVRTKLLAYGVGAALGGLSGAFLASYLTTVDPSQFTFTFSIFILAMVVIGGMGSIWGVVAGALLLSAIDTLVLPNVDLPQISSGLYGLLLVLAMLLRPAGLLRPAVPRRARR
jgi:branched-chain amino acid transport system permease protein